MCTQNEQAEAIVIDGAVADAPAAVAGFADASTLLAPEAAASLSELIGLELTGA